MAQTPPISTDFVILASVELAIYVSLAPVTGYIAWKHGKRGMLTWPVLISFFVARLIANAWQISKRDEPDQPDMVLSIIASASVVSLIFTIIGLVFEANWIACDRLTWLNKIMLVTTHGVTVAFSAIVKWGGSRKEDTLEPRNAIAEKVGYFVQIGVLVAVLLWAAQTLSVISKTVDLSRRRPTRYLVYAALIALPIQMIRLVYQATQVFVKTPSFNQYTGSLATRLVLIFLTQLGVVIVALGGGILSLRTWKQATV